MVLPDSLVRDAVGYIIQNPANFQEFTIAILHNDVYLSPDKGKSWKQLARKGSGL